MKISSQQKQPQTATISFENPSESGSPPWLSEDEIDALEGWAALNSPGLPWNEFYARDDLCFQKDKQRVLSGLQLGNLQPFFSSLEYYGPRFLAWLLTEEEILERLESWWWNKRADSEAKEHLRQLGEALAKTTPRLGRPRKYPQAWGKTVSNRLSTRRIRVNKHLEQMQTQFRKAERQLIAKGRGDHKTLWQAAQILHQEEHRKSEEKNSTTGQEACKQFLPWVKEYLETYP